MDITRVIREFWDALYNYGHMVYNIMYIVQKDCSQIYLGKAELFFPKTSYSYRCISRLKIIILASINITISYCPVLLILSIIHL